MKTFRLCIVNFIVFLVYTHLSHAESNQNALPQQTPNEIVFGQSANLSGSMKLYGIMIQHGILTYFNHINKQGGINGKKLRLITLNDYGNPLKSEKNIHRLKKQGVSMFLGNMGTRSLLKILPMVKNKEIGLFFPWGGSPELQNPNLSHIINGPGYLNPQLDAIVDDIIKNVRHRKIAIFHADDEFSTSAKDYLIESLKKLGIEPINIAAYNRFTMDISHDARNLIASDPKIVICISTSMPTIRLINQFFKTGHYATMFFGVDATLFTSNVLQGKGASFFYSSAVPDPVRSPIKLAQDYRQSLKKYFPDDKPNILSFTYYMSAAIVAQALKKNSETITPEYVLNFIEQMKNYDLDGYIINFNANNRHAYGDNITIVKGS